MTLHYPAPQRVRKWLFPYFPSAAALTRVIIFPILKLNFHVRKTYGGPEKACFFFFAFFLQIPLFLLNMI
jgi:hypothetical protein